jgi:hypothetical protein
MLILAFASRKKKILWVSYNSKNRPFCFFQLDNFLKNKVFFFSQRKKKIFSKEMLLAKAKFKKKLVPSIFYYFEKNNKNKEKEVPFFKFKNLLQRFPFCLQRDIFFKKKKNKIKEKDNLRFYFL